MSTKEDDPVPADAANPATSTKRKSAVDEIEVDVTAPEPPSKRARRALKKGKALPKKPDSDDDKEGADGEKKDKKEKARSEHSIWVGNLSFALTAADLRKWLIDNSGEVITDESITRIKLPTKREPGRDKTQKPANRGFAYVDFADIGGKVAAIALSETSFSGRQVLIKDATSFEGRPVKEREREERTPAGATQKEVDACRKVFVGNMSFKTTEDDLRRNFEKCGEIEWVKLATFEDSGKCKGFGWVRFKDPEAAAWAVKGFVKVKEEVETEDDFKAAEDGDGSGGEERPKQLKTRKWWVNRMLGRELKLELAEDDRTRYKKRFGKDATKRDGNAKAPRERNQRSSEPRAADEKTDGAADEAKPLTESDIQVARMMGTVVKHTGTKMTFD
ncbi:Nucleolar protein 13 [Tolypocladium capitatum]|uniref:Nucleolar protein 13 n=1 Tax=Tolypocladium capitatum TaxID=45235 RepID=A0A2K3Q9J5_9HYPO|nr:Nucleolar protein 13 [Tolypocladium capitatum]